MNRILRLLLPLFAGASIGAHAAPPQPADAVIASITQQVLAHSADRGSTGNAAELKAFIESTVMPNLDFRAMTARAVGPRWRSATEAQRTRLMAGFEALLVKTYEGAFEQAAGAAFRMKQTITIDASTAEVHSEVVARGGHDPIALGYRLALQDDRWRIVDISVMGVWLVPTYQTQFAEVIAGTGGIDGLVQALEAKAR